MVDNICSSLELDVIKDRHHPCTPLHPVFQRGGVRIPPNGADFGVDGSTLEYIER